MSTENSKNSDWELLDRNIFISRNLTFYFYDDNLINSIVISRETLHEEALFCLIEVISKIKRREKNYFKIKAKLQQLENKYGNSCFKLECEFHRYQMGVETHEFYLYFLHQGGVDNEVKQTERAIRLNIQYNEITIKQQSRTAICGPMLYLDLISHNNLQQWIELNIKMGYSKIVLYYFWIENMKLFEQLIFNYKDIVEIRPYLFIPNVNYVKKNQSSLYIDPKVYAKSLDNIFNIRIHWVHHRAIINGCFLSCFKHYDRIVVMDTDELIVPRAIKNFSETMYLKDTPCEISINRYIDNLNLKYSNKTFLNKISMWFPYVQYLDNAFVKSIFKVFKLSISNMTKFSKTFNITIQNNVNISILNEYDFQYLKRQIDLNEKFFKIFSPESNVFRRIWYLEESIKEEFGQGKVIMLKELQFKVISL